MPRNDMKWWKNYEKLVSFSALPNFGYTFTWNCNGPAKQRKTATNMVLIKTSRVTVCYPSLSGHPSLELTMVTFPELSLWDRGYALRYGKVTGQQLPTVSPRPLDPLQCQRLNQSTKRNKKTQNHHEHWQVAFNVQQTSFHLPTCVHMRLHGNYVLAAAFKPSWPTAIEQCVSHPQVENQWIDLGEILQETPYSIGKSMVSCRFFLKPIH